ncbi:hypothetical protein DKX38_016261 [Salix brachista]|uniref:Uncharacterized protein n=1 Tax=Salix brachista TaxID=2182728 RepID=A0A5N5L863_9ROSI|nr:hypothetical protein DKX38_016261 [Salix brachista]
MRDLEIDRQTSPFIHGPLPTTTIANLCSYIYSSGRVRGTCKQVINHQRAPTIGKHLEVSMYLTEESRLTMALHAR